MSNFYLKVVVTCALAIGLPMLAWSQTGYPGFETVGWVGLFAPTGTPKEFGAYIRWETAKWGQGDQGPGAKTD